MRPITCVMLAAAVLIAAAQPAWSQTQMPKTGVEQPPLIIKSTAGEDLYKFYCSNCHGIDAKGRPPSPAMRKAAPDLTLLASRNNGTFPRDRVAAVISNGSPNTPTHGTKDMPVWGAIFRGLGSQQPLVEIRIANLVSYLESIQAGSRRGNN